MAVRQKGVPQGCAYGAVVTVASQRSAGVLFDASLIRLRRTQITSRELCFWRIKITSFAPFGAGIRILRTNIKNVVKFTYEKLYSSTF